jgi:uncharacterized surface protein with fasciclin (FAS1) repeats
LQTPGKLNKNILFPFWLYSYPFSKPRSRQGQELKHDDGLFISSAKVIAADPEAGNGVAHVFDGILLP